MCLPTGHACLYMRACARECVSACAYVRMHAPPGCLCARARPSATVCMYARKVILSIFTGFFFCESTLLNSNYVSNENTQGCMLILRARSTLHGCTLRLDHSFADGAEVCSETLRDLLGLLGT
jgi:hypothetical protein